MAAYEVLLLNTAIPQIQAAQSGDTYLCPRELAVVVNTATDAVRITQTGAGNAILVEDSANPDSSPFVVTATGDVGIGTSSPAEKLQVVGNIQSKGSALSVTDVNGTNQWYINRENTTTGNLQFRSGATSLMELTPSGNLGLGTNSPTFLASGAATGVSIKSSSINAAGVNVSTSNSDNTRMEMFASYSVNQGGFYLKGDTAYPSMIFGQVIGSTYRDSMTLDASGNLQIGTTTSGGAYATFGNNSVAGANRWAAVFGTNSVSAGNPSSFGLTVGWNYSGGGGENNIIYGLSAGSTPGLAFSSYNGTTIVERARITSGGDLLVGDTTSAARIYAHKIDDGNTIGARNTFATFTATVGFLGADRNTTNNSFYYLDCYNYGSSTYRLRIADSGDVTNTNGTYGTISDAKMKTDIVDAGSQWADIKALRFRKFKMKDDPSGLVQLGVVAQEVELTSPGLVDEHADRDAEGNDLGTTTKSVKTSILLMKAAVALQEAMARIEKLEAEVAALKGA